MKKITCLFLCLLLLSGGCSGLYNARLEMVEPQNGLSFQDDTLQIAFAPFISDSLNSKIQNLSQENIKIIWEEALLTDPSGLDLPLIPLRDEEISPGLTAKPSLLEPGEIIEQKLIPRENIYYNLQARSYRSFPIVVTDNPLYSHVREYQGQSIKLLLPVQIGAEIREYFFEFVIDLRLIGQPGRAPEF